MWFLDQGNSTTLRERELVDRGAISRVYVEEFGPSSFKVGIGAEAIQGIIAEGGH